MADNLRERLNEGGTILMDGGCGTEIAARGVVVDELPLWSAKALFTEGGRAAVLDTHQAFADAGAQIIIANTFRTHQRIFDRASAVTPARAATLAACALARQVWRPGITIAGSAGPVGDCYTPEATPPQAVLAAAHGVHAENLAAGGVDLFLVETIPTIREAVAALAAGRAAGLPLAVSFCSDPTGTELLSGESFAAAIDAVQPYQPLAVCVNCVGPQPATVALEQLAATESGIPLGAYAQGSNDPTSLQSAPEGMAYDDYYLGEAKRWIDLGAQIVGGCCGVSPANIRDLAGVL